MNDLRPTVGFVNGKVASWYRDIGLLEHRAALPDRADSDVAIVGGSFTGLRTAYYLSSAEPDLRLAILEARFADSGASGRYGGWLSGKLAGYEATHKFANTVRMQQWMFAAVDGVIGVAELVGNDARIEKVRLWDPEPLRWQAVRELYKARHAADRQENALHMANTSPIVRLADTVTGR